MAIPGIGTGGFKANISPLVAEQYRRTKLFVSITESGERVVVDPSLTIARIYMYFYLSINLGSIVGQISMAYAEKVRSSTICAFVFVLIRTLVCGILARISVANCHILLLPCYSMGGKAPLYHVTSHWLSSRVFVASVALRCPW